MTLSQTSVAQQRVVCLADYKRPEYRIKHVDLDFTLHYTRTWVGSRLQIYRDPQTPYGTDLVLNGEELELVSVFLKLPSDLEARPLKLDSEAVYTKEEKTLRISGSLLPAGGKAETGALEPPVFELFTVVIVNPTANTELAGLYKSHDLLCTHCEAEGFRRITFYIDRPDIMATFRTILRAPKDTFPVLLSNGNLLNDNSGGSDIPSATYLPDVYDGKEKGTVLHAAVFEDPFPKPSYLFALVAGNLSKIEDSFTTCTKQDVTINLWCEPKDQKKLEWSLESVKKAMRWDEETFGRVFDLKTFHLVAIPHFNMGAMENKGLNIFNSSCLLASKDTTTDLEFERILAIVGHEYFHNWTGDRVTCRDWFQLTLKEGLTVYRDQTFSRDMGSSPAVVRLQDVNVMRSVQFQEDSGPLSHPIRPTSYVAIDNFYTLTVYRKGAEVIRMYATLLGEGGFRKGMDLYFERHDGQAVTCEDFRAAMADANEKDLTQFERWYSQAGTPVVTVTAAVYDEAKHTYRLTLKQELPATPFAAASENDEATDPGQCRPPSQRESLPKQQQQLPLHIPIAVGLLGLQSKQDLLTPSLETAGLGSTRVLELTEREQSFTFTNIHERPVASILRNFSAPIKLLCPGMTDDDYGFLMAYDTDAINRWDAGQRIMSKMILTLAKDMTDLMVIDKTFFSPEKHLPALMSVIYSGFAQILAAIKQRGNNDLSFLAFMMNLPNIHSLMQDMEACDPVLLHHTQCLLRQHLFDKFSEEMIAEYQRLTLELKDKPYDVNAADIGRRKLRNTLLTYITSSGNTDIAYAQYKSANNMTDRAGALTCLANYSTTAHCESALKHFLEQANGDAMCIDKWMSFQAGANHKAVVDHVEALTKHNLFDWANPNRVRAVVSVFANNLGHFHRADGRGYSLVADCVMRLDRVNSRIAARIATVLLSYNRLTSERQTLMRTALKRIIEMPGLSSHTAEIITKGL